MIQEKGKTMIKSEDILETTYEIEGKINRAPFRINAEYIEEELEQIRDYITQQEKVSELLELYRILFSLNDNFDDEDIYKIKNDIKLLEDELNDNK